MLLATTGGVVGNYYPETSPHLAEKFSGKNLRPTAFRFPGIATELDGGLRTMDHITLSPLCFSNRCPASLSATLDSTAASASEDSMIFTEVTLRGVYVIHTEKYEDERGFFLANILLSESSRTRLSH